MTRQSHAPGFTLIEVLVALAVLAVTLAAGLKAAGALTGNAARQVEVTAAQWCADNQLTNLRLSRAFPGVGSTEFKCEQLGRVYPGTVKIQGTPNPNFRRVDVQVLNDQGQGVVTLSTVLPRF